MVTAAPSAPPAALTSDPGPLPELAWLPVGKLRVDARYQRSLDTKRGKQVVEQIAGEFRWSAFQAILATPAGDGTWLIIDGQHRVAAARRRSIAHVPAVVIAAASVAEQAASFVAANGQRVALNPYALFHARLIAGDAAAHAIAERAKRAGIRIPKTPPPHGQRPPGVTMALGTLAALPRRFGEDVAELAVIAVADAYRTVEDGLRSNFFLGAAALIGEQPVAARAGYAARLTAALRPARPGSIEAEIVMRREKQGGTILDNAKAVMAARIDYPARALPVAADGARPSGNAVRPLPARSGAKRAVASPAAANPVAVLDSRAPPRGGGGGGNTDQAAIDRFIAERGVSHVAAPERVAQYLRDHGRAALIREYASQGGWNSKAGSVAQQNRQAVLDGREVPMAALYAAANELRAGEGLRALALPKGA